MVDRAFSSIFDQKVQYEISWILRSYLVTKGSCGDSFSYLLGIFQGWFNTQTLPSSSPLLLKLRHSNSPGLSWPTLRFLYISQKSGPCVYFGSILTLGEFGTKTDSNPGFKATSKSGFKRPKNSPPPYLLVKRGLTLYMNNPYFNLISPFFCSSLDLH